MKQNSPRYLRNVEIIGLREVAEIVFTCLKKVAGSRYCIGDAKYAVLVSSVSARKSLCDVHLLFKGLLRVK
jgi:hypothetical protein